MNKNTAFKRIEKLKVVRTNISELDIQALNILTNSLEKKKLEDIEFWKIFLVGTVFWVGFCIILLKF